MGSNPEIQYLDISPLESVTINKKTYFFGTARDALNIPADKFTEDGDAHIPGGFLCFTQDRLCSVSNQKMEDCHWVFRIGNNKISGDETEKLLQLKQLYQHEEIGELCFFPEIGVRTYKYFINFYCKEQYESVRKGYRFIVTPLQSVTYRNRCYTFGDSWQTVSKLGTLKRYHIDYPTGYSNALLSDVKVTLRHNHLTSVRYWGCKDAVELIIGDLHGTPQQLLPKLMANYKYQIIKEYPASSLFPLPAKLCLFPELGLLLSDNGLDLTAGITSEVEYEAVCEQKSSKTYVVKPFEGYETPSGNTISFGLTYNEVNTLNGVPNQMDIDANVMKEIKQIRDDGMELLFRQLTTLEDAPLSEVTFFERDQDSVIVNDISVFADKKLDKLKELYPYRDSKCNLSTLFPTLGIYCRGCGGKKNNKKGAEGKLIIAFSQPRLTTYEQMLKME